MFNQIILIGRVVKKPELITLDSGTKVTNLRIAVQKPYRNQTTMEYESDFFNVTLWKGLAEVGSAKFVKGSVVSIKGRLTNDSYVTKDDKKVTLLQVVAERVSLLSLPKSIEEEILEDEAIKEIED